MKILYVSTISNTINAFLMPHIKMLINDGHKVDVAFSVRNPVKKEIIDMGCKVYTLEFKRTPINMGNYRAYRNLKKIIMDRGYDLVHTHTPIASSVARMACRNIGDIKVFYTAHGFHFHKGAPLKNWLIYYPIEKFLSKYTDCLITINEEDHNTVINRKFKTKRIKKVNGVGIDLSKFELQTMKEKKLGRKKYGYKEDDFILFYAAELNSNKNQSLLINVINVLRNEVPNIKLLLAGRGPSEAKYKRQVARLGLGSHIHFLGYRGDIPELLKLSDIAVASSRREGLPVNVMEAMATGLPLVVTDVRGHKDLVRNYENGYIVDIDDVIGFAKSIKLLYKDEKLREKFGQKSIELVQDYSLENVLEEMKEIYEQVQKGNISNSIGE